MTVTNEDLAAQIAVNTHAIEQNTAETRRIADHVAKQNGRIGKLEHLQAYASGRADALRSVREGRAWVYPAVVSAITGLIFAVVNILAWALWIK